MRVLRFLGFPIKNFSSLEHMVLAHCEHLNESGHYAECVYDGIWNQEAADLAVAFAKKTKIHFDFPFAPGFNPAARFQYFRKALRLIRQGQFDVVDAYFEPSSRVLNYVARYCPRTVFVNTLGNPLHQRSRFAPVRALKRWYAVHVRKNFDGLIAVSQFVRDDLLKTGLPSNKMRIVRNCIDVERFRPPSPRTFGGTRLHVSFTGRLAEQKNLDVLIRAAKFARDKLSDKEFQVLIYGEGHLRPVLENLINELELKRSVHLRGHSDSIRDVLHRETDIYCHPSIYEGLSASLLEAMAAGCPIVASNIPSNMEVIRDGETGLLFHTESPEDLASKLIVLANDIGLQERLSRNAQNLAESEFTLQNLISNTNDFYQELLDQKRSLRS